MLFDVFSVTFPLSPPSLPLVHFFLFLSLISNSCMMKSSLDLLCTEPLPYSKKMSMNYYDRSTRNEETIKSQRNVKKIRKKKTTKAINGIIIVRDSPISDVMFDITWLETHIYTHTQSSIACNEFEFNNLHSIVCLLCVRQTQLNFRANFKWKKKVKIIYEVYSIWRKTNDIQHETFEKLQTKFQYYFCLCMYINLAAISINFACSIMLCERIVCV